MLKIEGVVVGIRDASYNYEGKKVEKYVMHVGDPNGGDPIEIGCKVNGRKFGDKVNFPIRITHGKNGKVYLNEVVEK